MRGSRCRSLNGISWVGAPVVFVGGLLTLFVAAATAACAIGFSGWTGGARAARQDGDLIDDACVASVVENTGSSRIIRPAVDAWADHAGIGAGAARARGNQVLIRCKLAQIGGATQRGGSIHTPEAVRLYGAIVG